MIKETNIPTEIMTQMKSETAAAFYLELMSSEAQEEATNDIMRLLAA